MSRTKRIEATDGNFEVVPSAAVRTREKSGTSISSETRLPLPFSSTAPTFSVYSPGARAMPKEATKEPSGCTSARTGCSLQLDSSPSTPTALVATTTWTTFWPSRVSTFRSGASPRMRPMTPVTPSETLMKLVSMVSGKSCRGVLSSARAGEFLGSWSSRVTRCPSSPVRYTS